MSERAGQTYDVFISYSKADQGWVKESLLPQLEQAGLRGCVEYRDFEIGVPRLVNIERAVDRSRHTLVVLSPEWVAGEWNEFESLLVSTTDPAGRRRKLLPLLLRPCDLPPRLAMLTAVDFTDPERYESEWPRLLAALSAPSSAEAPPASQPRPEPHPAPQRRATAHTPIQSLRQGLSERCSLSDLRDLCFVMGIDADNFPKAKGSFVRELLLYLQRRGRLAELEETVRAEKPWALQDRPPSQAAPTRTVPRARLPTRCPHCSAMLNPEEVDWIDNTTAECAYCDGVVYAAG